MRRQTIRTVRTIPHAIPVTMTTKELEELTDRSKVDLLPVTAFESVTPAKKGDRFVVEDERIEKSSIFYVYIYKSN